METKVKTVFCLGSPKGVKKKKLMNYNLKKIMLKGLLTEGFILQGALLAESKLILPVSKRNLSLKMRLKRQKESTKRRTPLQVILINWLSVRVLFTTIHAPDYIIIYSMYLQNIFLS